MINKLSSRSTHHAADLTSYVRHVIHTEAAATDYTIAPLLVQCRDWAASGAPGNVREYVSSWLNESYSMQVAEDRIHDLLTLGSAYLVFDGIDEVIDLSQRRSLIQKIESLARQYPLAPILATSRRVGYTTARFKTDHFQLYELNEFSREQFLEYASKWFKVASDGDHNENAFIRETESIPDICHNPLMLSLLCTLYRARGYIPRNRRHVYRECSDLLFQRWDAMRHIEQPFDHRQYGMRMMQELARFFHGSQTAQSGVEESQLIGIIAKFFEDTASIDPADSRDRAKAFVDFCADRAWLLSKKGNDAKGRRLFAFTHRTFMEYFAAESIARIATSIEDAMPLSLS